MKTNGQPEDDVKQHSKKRKVLSAILWIIGWPIIVGGIGLIIIIVAAAYVENSSMNAPQGYHMRGMWALFVGVIVLICYLLMWLKKRENKPLGNISVAVLRTYMWLGIIISAGIMAAIPDPEATASDAGINVTQTNTLFKPTLQSDATINAALSRIGATDTEWVETKFVAEYNDPNFVDKAGEYQAFVDTAGNFSYGVLSAKQGTSGSELDSVIAHEYLHHIWFKTIAPDAKIKLTSDLIALYGKDAAMQERVATYADSQALQPTELFSYYCTEASDSLLTPYVLAECNRYINRSTLVYYR